MSFLFGIDAVFIPCVEKSIRKGERERERKRKKTKEKKKTKTKEKKKKKVVVNLL